MPDRDYRIVVQDMTNVYIGALLTYAEIMDLDEIPFKLKSILDHTILKEVDADTTISDHVFFIKYNDVSYKTYSDMHARFRLNVPKSTNEGIRYESREYTISEIVSDDYLHSIMDNVWVEELHIGKLYLLGNYGHPKDKNKGKKRLVNIEDYIDEFLGEEDEV